MERERVAERRRARGENPPEKGKKRCFPKGRSQGSPKRSRRKEARERASVPKTTDPHESQPGRKPLSLFRGLVKEGKTFPFPLTGERGAVNQKEEEGDELEGEEDPR